jgi:4-amino-4-deoxy-L-arabinose transferase-like glycosyltransferase
MFTTGCQAETEMVFIALVAGSLLVWHWGEVRGWPPVRTWIISYVLVGLGVLCKGPQPPAYFLMAVGAYLLCTGQWRRLLGRAHWIGAAAGAAVVLAWLVPCALRTSWPEVWGIFMNDTSSRFRDWKVLDVLVHLVQFPLEVLGCTLPWSLFLFAFASRGLRRSLGEARPHALFTATCLATAFPTCWLPPEGQTRYIAPVYPCLAVLSGVALQACMRADVPARLLAGWRYFATGFAVVMLMAAAAVVLAAFLLRNNPRYGEWAEPRSLALAYAAAVASLALLAIRGRRAGDSARVQLAVMAVAVYMVLTFTGVVTDARVRRSEDQASAVAHLKEQLPPGQRLVSLGHIDALFAYYFAEPIDPFPSSRAEAEKLLAGEDFYFCFDAEGDRRPPLPFAWQELAVISMDRNRHPTPMRAVVVGRRFRVSVARAGAGTTVE